MRLAREALIAWTPGTAQVEVGPWPDRRRWSDRYDFTDGACCAEFHDLSDDLIRRFLLAIFHTMVVRDAVDPQAAHRALSEIHEFASSINREASGAA